MTASTQTTSGPAQTSDVVQQFISKIVSISDPDELRDTVGGFIDGLPDQLQRRIVHATGLLNPLYAPDDGFARRYWQNSVGQLEFTELTLRFKRAVQELRAPRVLLACPRKTASTFLSSVLVSALGAQETLLTLPTASLPHAGALGAAMREHEMDELAMLRACFLPNGFVSQQHVRCTPYLSSQLKLYKIKPIVLKRNIFDALVSLDDMCFEAAHAHGPEKFYFFTHLPYKYGKLDADERMAILIKVYLPWYAQFYLSWQKCEASGLVSPLWISYEDDIKGAPEKLAAKLADYIGPQFAKPDRIVAAIAENTGKKALKFNKGVVGRGGKVSAENRKAIEQFFEIYAEELDLKGLL